MATADIGFDLGSAKSAAFRELITSMGVSSDTLDEP